MKNFQQGAVTLFFWKKSGAIKIKIKIKIKMSNFEQYQEIDNTQHDSISSRIKSLKQFLELCKMTLEPTCLENLQLSVDSVIEISQDFTDSAYISHDFRENILLLTDRLKLEIDHLLEFLSTLVIYLYSRNNNRETV